MTLGGRSPRSGARSLKPSAQTVWAVSFTALVVLGFVFYHDIVPNLNDSVAQGVSSWASPTAINECLIYVIMALGLNIVVGYAGLLDLGYVAFWAIGSYIGAYLMSDFIFQVKSGIHIGSVSGVSTTPGLHINFWLVLIVGAVVCAIFGILIGAPTLRLRGDYLAVVTLGFGEIIPQSFTNGGDVNGTNFTNGTQGISPVDPVNNGILSAIGFPTTLTLSPEALPFKFLIFSVLAAICVFVSLRLRNGRLGRAWLAIREDELAANMMGVNLVRTKLSAYAVGAFFGGLGGVAYAIHVGGALPDSFKFQNSVFILIMVVLGGMGNVWGVIIGALVLAWVNNTGLQQVGNSINNAFGTNVDFVSYNFLIFGVVLVLMMLFRPAGILPEKRTKRLLAMPSRTESESLGADITELEAEAEADLTDPLEAHAEQHEESTAADGPPGTSSTGTSPAVHGGGGDAPAGDRS